MSTIRTKMGSTNLKKEKDIIFVLISKGETGEQYMNILDTSVDASIDTSILK